MAKECLCNKNGDVLVFPCSGGSNCGQIANQVALEITEDGIGTIFCLAGVGANIASIVDAAKTAKRIIAVDGCSVGCAKKILNNAGLNITDHIDITQEGITKNNKFKLSQQDVFFITKRVRQELKKEK